MIIFTHLPSKRVACVLILYNFTQVQKYFTLALLVLLVTNMMSVFLLLVGWFFFFLFVGWFLSIYSSCGLLAFLMMITIMNKGTGGRMKGYFFKSFCRASNRGFKTTYCSCFSQVIILILLNFRCYQRAGQYQSWWVHHNKNKTKPHDFMFSFLKPRVFYFNPCESTSCLNLDKGFVFSRWCTLPSPSPPSSPA